MLFRSVDHYDEPLDSASDEVAGLVAELLDDERLTDPDWVDDQGWRYALPDSSIDAADARCAEDAGIYVAGDWVAGEGRVHRAFENGRTVGERVAGHE